LQALEDFKIVRAPFDGIVSARNTDIGALVNSGSGNPLFVVAQIKPLRVFVSVPESLAEDIKIGQDAGLKFNEFPDRRTLPRGLRPDPLDCQR
jgi:multidrug resistance efflux pump